MKIFNEHGIELDKNNLDYNLGYLTKQADKEFVYHLFSEEIILENKANNIKEKLKETEDKAIAFADGLISEEEYSLIKEERQSLLKELKLLEK